MSYVQSVIVPGERVVASAQTHWFIYVRPVFWLLLGLVFLVILPVGLALLLLASIDLVRAILYATSTELAVTNRRVIAKFGFIRRNTVELRNDRIESLHVNQGILGRIFNFGSLVITGSGGTNAPIPYIANPLGFRSSALASSE